MPGQTGMVLLVRLRLPDSGTGGSRVIKADLGDNQAVMEDAGCVLALCHWPRWVSPSG